MERRSSGAGMGILFILIALIFIVGPIAASGLGVPIPGLGQLLIVAFGVMVLFVGMVTVVITRLYRKTSADEAFVRTGMGGQKGVIDGGALVVPVVHEVIPVSLQTMKLTVIRTSAEALITGDNLRADVIAEFFIKVQKTAEDVLAAATSLGHKAINPKDVEMTVFEKLVNALRTVAATKTLNELHTKRDDFASAVQAIVSVDLKHNGLTLESTTISKLDQTPTRDLRPEDNVFDAQGARRIAEITQQARIDRNKIEREADQRVKEQDVERDKFVYQQDVERETAEAERDKSIRVAKVTTEQEALVTAAEQERLAQLAQVQRDAAVQVAEVEKARAIEVANQGREQAARQAEIEKERALEIAEREKETVVAQKEKERADAESARYTAEALAEKEKQAVVTVQVVAEAERDKNRTVIAQQAEAERVRLQRQMEADVTAYTVVTAARGEQEAAEKRGAARLTLAQADQQALKLEAEGKQALELVPVQVERERVAVKREDLKNQAEFEKIARELQVELARIAAEKDVRVEQARAAGAALSKTTMTVWGTPQDVSRMTAAFLGGQANGYYLHGVLDTAPQPVTDAAVGLTNGLTSVLTSLAQKLAGGQIDPAMLEEIAKHLAAHAASK